MCWTSTTRPLVIFLNNVSSCAGRCGEGYARTQGCQCDHTCHLFDECCPDYKTLCSADVSCKGRCNEPFKRGRSCDCDADCERYHKCCPDYAQTCLGEFSKCVSTFSLHANADKAQKHEKCSHNNQIFTFFFLCGLGRESAKAASKSSKSKVVKVISEEDGSGVDNAATTAASTTAATETTTKQPSTTTKLSSTMTTTTVKLPSTTGTTTTKLPSTTTKLPSTAATTKLPTTATTTTKLPLTAATTKLPTAATTTTKLPLTTTMTTTTTKLPSTMTTMKMPSTTATTTTKLPLTTITTKLPSTTAATTTKLSSTTTMTTTKLPSTTTTTTTKLPLTTTTMGMPSTTTILPSMTTNQVDLELSTQDNKGTATSPENLVSLTPSPQPEKLPTPFRVTTTKTHSVLSSTASSISEVLTLSTVSSVTMNEDTSAAALKTTVTPAKGTTTISKRDTTTIATSRADRDTTSAESPLLTMETSEGMDETDTKDTATAQKETAVTDLTDTTRNAGMATTLVTAESVSTASSVTDESDATDTGVTRTVEETTIGNEDSTSSAAGKAVTAANRSRSTVGHELAVTSITNGPTSTSEKTTLAVKEVTADERTESPAVSHKPAVDGQKDTTTTDETSQTTLQSDPTQKPTNDPVAPEHLVTQVNSDLAQSMRVSDYPPEIPDSYTEASKELNSLESASLQNILSTPSTLLTGITQSEGHYRSARTERSTTVMEVAITQSETPSERDSLAREDANNEPESDTRLLSRPSPSTAEILDRPEGTTAIPGTTTQRGSTIGTPGPDAGGKPDSPDETTSATATTKTDPGDMTKHGGVDNPDRTTSVSERTTTQTDPGDANSPSGVDQPDNPERTTSVSGTTTARTDPADTTNPEGVDNPDRTTRVTETTPQTEPGDKPSPEGVDQPESTERTTSVTKTTTTQTYDVDTTNSEGVDNPDRTTFVTEMTTQTVPGDTTKPEGVDKPDRTPSFTETTTTQTDPTDTGSPDGVNQLDNPETTTSVTEATTTQTQPGDKTSPESVGIPDGTPTLHLSSTKGAPLDEDLDVSLSFFTPSVFACFLGHYYWLLDGENAPSPSPRKITEVWGIPSPIDTVFSRCNCDGKTFFFKDSQYWRFTNDKMDEHYPKPIIKGFGGLNGKIVTALSVGKHRNRPESVYFFKKGGGLQQYTYKQEGTKKCKKKVRTVKYPMYKPKAVIRKRRRFERAVRPHQIFRSIRIKHYPVRDYFAFAGVLQPEVQVASYWRGFPKEINSVISIPNDQKPDGYDYYAFSKDQYYHVDVGSRIARPVTQHTGQTVSSAWYKCPLE
uniref:SMB domain-containing protein n=1 Tax=Varanus komodoensis TaxID=61221 RepID=A0A8D2J0T0_VARKO